MRKCARAILISSDNKLVLIKRTKENIVYYVTVGGNIENNETSEQAVKRELIEETGSIH